MKANPTQARSLSRAGLLVAIAALMAGCVGDQQAQERTGSVETASVMPRQATYDCGDDGRIVVEGAANAVRLTEADGNSYDLPASPPTQTSRFGEGGLALVVEDGEALWMKAGSEPVSCRR